MRTGPPPEVVFAPASVDAALGLFDAPGPRLVVVTAPSRPFVAALAAAVQGSTTTSVLAGRPDEVARCLSDVADRLPPGRLVSAAEWLADPDAALLGAPGLAWLHEPAADDRPRTLAESPLPPPEPVRLALESAARSVELRRYPAITPDRLAAALAHRHGVEAACIAVSSGGSLELIGQVLRAFTAPGDPVVSHAPAFHGLVTACLREGRPLRLVPEPDGGDSLRALERALPGARLACVATPNALDSRRFPAASIDRIRAVLGPGRLLLVDEAYAGFAPELDLPALEDRSDLAPVVRLRTLSKLEGLAALRIGYALASARVAGLLRRLSLPYALSPLHEAAALAAVLDDRHRLAVAEVVARTRAMLVEGLSALGFEVSPSTTHLLLARPSPERFGSWSDVCEALGLPMEPCPEVEGTFQLSVPSESEARALLESLRVAAASRSS